VGGIEFQAQIVDDFFEFTGAEVPESGRLYRLITDVRDSLQDSDKIFLGFFPEGIQLDRQGAFHVQLHLSFDNKIIKVLQ
jgi:hypothetical protein